MKASISSSPKEILEYAKQIFFQRHLQNKSSRLSYLKHEQELIILLFQKGFTKSTIYKELKIGQSTVYRVLKENECKRKPTPRCLEVVDVKVVKPLSNTSIKQDDYCEIYISNSFIIKTNTTAITSSFLKELKKAVE